ncbi:RNA BINDING PROTEIN [Salix purpurea]|uniref:RNA BINDING PROTEIN n=1 Tax=Salix purpurea TaxID=77065 RepID=A0A9Q0WYG8_SALPP|nr:RNA BINDING PROTEIN [Salix purpurea]
MAAAVASPAVTAQPAAVAAPAAGTAAAGQFQNASLYVGDLEHNVNEGQLFDLFNQVAQVVSIKVCRDQARRASLGYAYVNFSNPQDAANAMELLNFTPLNGKAIRIMVSHRDPIVRKSGHANVFIKNLDTSIDNKALQETFASFGPVLSCKVAVDNNGQSKGYGFVQFENEEAAQSAIDRLNELKARFEQERNSRYEKLKAANLYLKNLDEKIDDEKLKELFSEFGSITSCKVMLDQQGLSKGSGFVAFSTPEEASRALNEMNGKMIGKKPLYVAVAQRREERKVRLQAHFAQIQAPGLSPLPSGLPGYHPGAPRLAPQQLYFGQGTAGMMPPQPTGYGFQQQLLPGMRAGVGPNFVMQYQMQRQGQQAQRMGIRHGGNHQQIQQQQQLLHRNTNQGLRYMGNARNGIDSSAFAQGFVGPVMPITISDAQRTTPVPISALTTALASATPEKRMVMLGEQLYPLVERLEPEHVAKVTGMLLEMDQTEVLHLIESPDALKKKVAEAMQVLQEVGAASSVGDQLGSLALNE